VEMRGGREERGQPRGGGSDGGGETLGGLPLASPPSRSKILIELQAFIQSRCLLQLVYQRLFSVLEVVGR
jgi:hypothetical protein